MSNVIEDAIHLFADVLSGRRNLAPHEADAIHEAIKPGYTDVPLSAEEQAQLDELQARQARLAAEQAARQQPAPAPEPAPEPAAVFQPEPEPASEPAAPEPEPAPAAPEPAAPQEDQANAV